MARKLPPEAFYRILDPKNFYAAMRNDVTLLLEHRAYLSLTTVIVCCLDALAADSGKATRGKFEAFVTEHLPDLCSDLGKACPGKKGAATLYDGFRNGFAHSRGPKGEFAIAEDHELGGVWAEQIEVDAVGRLVALNTDRLAREFLMLLGQLEADSGQRGSRKNISR
jgi:hypothetical protein